jgi:hypothetical protein
MSLYQFILGYSISAMIGSFLLIKYTSSKTFILAALVMLLLSHIIGYIDGYVYGMEKEYERVN